MPTGSHRGCGGVVGNDRFGIYRLVDAAPAPAAGDAEKKRRNFAAHGCLRRHVPDATRHGYEIDS